MSWGTYYKYNGYLRYISKHELDDKVDECNETIRRVFQEIIAYMAMTPPPLCQRLRRPEISMGGAHCSSGKTVSGRT